MTKYDERRLRFPASWRRRSARSTDEQVLPERRPLRDEVSPAPIVDVAPEPSRVGPTSDLPAATAVAPGHVEVEATASSDAASSVAVLVEPVPDPDEPAADTVIMPVVGDRVQYSRGSGHLVGLLGVVVSADDGTALPQGLRYVLFDDEEWPTVVTVTELDRE